MDQQLLYGQAVSPGRLGSPVDQPERVVSLAADETTRYGRVAVYKSTDRTVGKLPRATQCVILDDGGTYTAGNMPVTINGVSLTVTYNTDKATTMGDIATAIAGLAFVSSATYAAGSNTITVVMEADVDVHGVALDVSGITGTMTITSYTYTNGNDLAGLVQRNDRLPYGTQRIIGLSDKAVLTLSGDVLNTSDTVDGYVFGAALATVTYATSEAVTLQLVANEIRKVPGIDDAVVDTTARTITVTARAGRALTATLTVTDNALASVAPSFATTYSTQAAPISETDAAYLPTETMDGVRKGRVWCLAEEAIALGDTVFVRVATTTTQTNIGALRNDADSGTCQAISGLSFISASATDPDGNRIVQVEVNLP